MIVLKYVDQNVYVRNYKDRSNWFKKLHMFAHKIETLKSFRSSQKCRNKQ